MVSAQNDSEKAIVIRDRRKPNQYTTDNVIAREWLPILRVGDAFFFYSVYLSMANKETESSWSSLRTLASYLQCGIDLIIRGNKLLEICELIYVETGNQRTSNEYYILDPPSLTPELRERIIRRLDDIAEEQTSKNWQSWVDQVKKVLDRHRSLPNIWAERRANRGGRPRTTRPTNPACDSQAGFAENGACGSQPQSMWLTSPELVSHDRSAREPQAEQERQTRDIEQERYKESEHLFLLVRQRCQHLGVADPILDVWAERYPAQYLARQLDWLPSRHPRDPAAMLVSAVQQQWEEPANYDAEQSRQIWDEWLAAGAAPAPAGGDDESGSSEIEAESALVVPGTDLDVHRIWARVLEELRLQMTRATFDTWLRGSRVVDVRGGALVVRVRDGYAVEWLRARWLAPIQRTVAGVVGCDVGIQFEAA
jgi:hypothetical protein